MARIGKGFTIGKDGKIKRARRKVSVSEAIRRVKSKRVKVVRRGTTT